MTFKPRKRFAHATLAAAATITLALLACETPTPPQAAEIGVQEPVLASVNADSPDSVSIVVRPHVRIRSTEGTEEPQPLFVVDGVIVDPASGFDIEGLDPDKIERIEVVKGASAEALYGERAAGGVINIYLKAIVRTPGSDSTGS